MSKSGLKLAQCDRCKKVFVVAPAFETFSINHRLSHGVVTEQAVYDFCPECQASLKAWLKNEQEK